MRQTHASPPFKSINTNLPNPRMFAAAPRRQRMDTSQECNTEPISSGRFAGKNESDIKNAASTRTTKRSCAIVRGSAERWQSGRLYLTRNQALGNQPRVRIPPSPPERTRGPTGPFVFPPESLPHISGNAKLPCGGSTEQAHCRPFRLQGIFPARRLTQTSCTWLARHYNV